MKDDDGYIYKDVKNGTMACPTNGLEPEDAHKNGQRGLNPRDVRPSNQACRALNMTNQNEIFGPKEAEKYAKGNNENIYNNATPDVKRNSANLAGKI